MTNPTEWNYKGWKFEVITDSDGIMPISYFAAYKQMEEGRVSMRQKNLFDASKDIDLQYKFWLDSHELIDDFEEGLNESDT